MGMLKIARFGLRCRSIAARSQALRSFALQANTQFSTLLSVQTQKAPC
jgi:hypothetical protein